MTRKTKTLKINHETILSNTKLCTHEIHENLNNRRQKPEFRSRNLLECDDASPLLKRGRVRAFQRMLISES